MNISEKITSRKFWLTVIVLGGMTIFFIMGKIASGQYISIVELTMSLYIGGNVLNSMGYNISRSYYNRTSQNITPDGGDV